MTTEELNNRQQRKKRQAKQGRLNIVAEYYKKGYSLRKIAEKVQELMGLSKPPAWNTIKNDIATLTQEWLENRLDDYEELVQLELERIDDCLVELWEAWNKSKQDYTQQKAKQKHLLPQQDGKTGKAGKGILMQSEQQRNEVRKYGDVSYIAEIRRQLMERRKLLGLYKPDKRELTGKDGAPLNPQTKAQTNINVGELSEEELALLCKLAAQRDKQQE